MFNYFFALFYESMNSAGEMPDFVIKHLIFKIIGMTGILILM